MEQFIPPRAEIAFFDFDETVINADSDRLWALWRSLRSPLGWIELAWIYGLYRSYRKGKMGFDDYIRFNRFRVGRYRPEMLDRMASKFFNEKGRCRIYSEAWELIERHRVIGSRVVMLTAQFSFMVQPFCRYLSMDHCISNRLEIRGNRFAGPVIPYCFGEGKIFWARKYAEGIGVGLEDCAFYSDSVNDLPLMKRVGYPVAINPDTLLREEALRAGWPIINFGDASCQERSASSAMRN